MHGCNNCINTVKECKLKDKYLYHCIVCSARTQLQEAYQYIYCVQTITTACCFGTLAADPPRITTHPREIKDAVPGNQVAFTIQATGTEPLNYQWEHKTGDGNEVERIPGANRSTLTIPKVKKSDKGSYHCIVSNCAGSETSKFATLTVGKIYIFC